MDPYARIDRTNLETFHESLWELMKDPLAQFKKTSFSIPHFRGKKLVRWRSFAYPRCGLAQCAGCRSFGEIGVVDKYLCHPNSRNHGEIWEALESLIPFGEPICEKCSIKFEKMMEPYNEAFEIKCLVGRFKRSIYERNKNDRRLEQSSC